MILFAFKIFIASLAWIVKERPKKNNKVRSSNNLDLISDSKRFDDTQKEVKRENEVEK